MRILLAVHHFPPNYTGGAEWEAYRIASHLINRSHQVQVLCVEQVTNSKSEELTWKDDIYKDVPVRRLFLKMSSAYGEFTKWEFDNPLVGRHVEKLISEYKPDVFHLMSGYLLTGRCLRAAKAKNIPTVLSLMDFWFLCRRITMLRSDGELSKLPIDPAVCAQCIGEEKKGYQWLGRIFPKAMKYYWKRRKSTVQLFKERQAFSIDTLNNVNLIICRSQFFLDFYAHAGVDKDRIVLSRQGFDIEKSSPEGLEPDQAEGKLRIGYMGQIAPVKGVHVLIKAVVMVENPNVELNIFGNEKAFPDYSNQLRQLAKNDRRVHFSGQFNREDLYKVMQGLDILVVPSLWYENSPNVILEAFATHTPVIASNLGGMAELIKNNENGMLFPAGDVYSLAGQIKELLETPGLIEQLRKGVEPVKSVESEMDELEKIYASVLK